MLATTRIGGKFLAFAAAFLLCGCATPNTLETFLRPKVDLTYIRTIAVLPIENRTREDYPAARSRELTSTQLLNAGWFEVVDARQVDSVLREEALVPPFDNTALKRLGQRLGVQAFVMGSLDYAGDGRVGNVSYPEIALNLKLVDSTAGLVLWQCSGRGSGYSLGNRLFGVSQKDSFEVTLDLVRAMLRTLGEPPKKTE